MILGKDYKEHKKLYLACFKEDSEKEAELLFKTVLCGAECLCEYEGDKPIAMLFLMESNLVVKGKKLPFYYLYAAATDPEHRGKGLMKNLLLKAKEFSALQGKCGIFLKPANPPLFNFYALSDFKPFFKINKITVLAESLKNFTLKGAKTEEIPPNKWQKKRLELLNPISDCYADFSEDLYKAATLGCRVSQLYEAFAVWEMRDDLLLVKEAFYTEHNQEALLTLCYSLAKNNGAKQVEIRLPSALTPTLLDGCQEVDFSVIWHNCPSLKDVTKPYHGFAFD